MSESSEKRRSLQPETSDTLQTLIERVQRLENEKEALRLKLWKQRRKPSGAIAYILLLLGATVLILSILQVSIILAFIGLSLTFWGALFLYIKPVRYVRPSLVDSTAISSLETINQVISDLNYEGKAVHLPPLPYFLKGYKGGTVYISAKKDQLLPPIEELTREKVFISNPKGVCLVPPGVGLTNLYEEELGKEFANADFEYLKDNLRRLFVENLEIASNFTIDKTDNRIDTRITGSIFNDFCQQVRKFGPICSSFGCPLCSSLACTLARTLGKPIIIEKAQLSSDSNTIEAYFRAMEE